MQMHYLEKTEEDMCKGSFIKKQITKIENGKIFCDRSHPI